MREVEHAHHAEDDRQSAGQQKQQHAEQHAVEGRDYDQIEHDTLTDDGYDSVGQRSEEKGQVGSMKAIAGGGRPRAAPGTGTTHFTSLVASCCRWWEAWSVACRSWTPDASPSRCSPRRTAPWR